MQNPSKGIFPSFSVSQSMRRGEIIIDVSDLLIKNCVIAKLVQFLNKIRHFYINRSVQFPSDAMSKGYIFWYFKMSRESMSVIHEILKHLQVNKQQAHVVLYLSCPSSIIDLHQVFFFSILESIALSHRFQEDFSKQIQHNMQRKLSIEDQGHPGGMIILRSQSIKIICHNNNSGIALN